MVTYDEIKNQEQLVGEQYKSSTTDEDWRDFNSNYNKLGQMLEEFGRTRYRRNVKIDLILDEQDD